ncbi:histidine phosphatase superfamily [Pestalotiopsis sp. NC0098]|nr:histidine phosphatase superfamily [Pestalotiopsis sp. NC0098]
MSLEAIYVVRHGFRSSFTVDPATGVYTAGILSPTGIPTDPPLTSYGKEQAGELADHLMTIDPPVDRVVSSPYYRCLQTIEPFVAKRNQQANTSQTKIEVEAGVGEWFGHATSWEHPAPAPLARLRELFPDVDEAYQSLVTPPRHGETLAQLHDRVAAAADRIVARCDREGHRAVVISTHAATIIALGRVLTGNMPDSVEVDDFAAYTCGLSRYRRRTGTTTTTSSQSAPDLTEPPKWRGGLGIAGGWICETDSDCSFLSGGPERGWRFAGDESFAAVDGHSLAGSGAGLGVDVEGPGRKQQEPTLDGSKL